VSGEWDSASYHRLSNPQFGWGLRTLKKLQSLPLRGNEHILDAGCGTGRVTAELLKAFPNAQVTAVDASQNMVDEARKSLAGFGRRVTVQRLDLLDLSAQSAYDVIFSTAVFHWIKDHDRLFANLFRALKPGGILLAQCGGGPNLKRLHGRAQLVMDSPQFAPYFKDWKKASNFADPESTAERLTRAGFADVTTSLAPEPTPMPDEQMFRQFLASVNLHMHLARIPRELHDAFLTPLAQQAAQDDPPFVLEYWRLNMQARKP